MRSCNFAVIAKLNVEGCQEILREEEKIIAAQKKNRVLSEF